MRNTRVEIKNRNKTADNNTSYIIIDQDSGKSESSIRDMYLNDGAMWALSSLKEINGKFEYVPSTKSGTPTSPRTFAATRYLSPVALREHFWDMFIADALLGNFDRHNGNWGFLYDDSTEITELAPAFDCGSCLLPQADDKVLEKVLANESELHAMNLL